MSVFEHVQLQRVDPNFELIPAGTYTFQVLKAAKVGYPKDNPVNEKVDFQVAIANDERFSGRRLFPTLFDDDKSLKIMRKIMDATGILHEDGEPLEEWLTRLVTERAEFKAEVQVVPDMRKGVPNPNTAITNSDGTVTAASKNQLNFWSVVPA